MRAIQEYFREIDMEQLINFYLYKYPISSYEMPDGTVMIDAAIYKYNEYHRKKELQELLDGLNLN